MDSDKFLNVNKSDLLLYKLLINLNTHFFLHKPIYLFL
jgi:hypothetical protein